MLSWEYSFFFCFFFCYLNSMRKFEVYCLCPCLFAKGSGMDQWPFTPFFSWKADRKKSKVKLVNCMEMDFLFLQYQKYWKNKLMDLLGFHSSEWYQPTQGLQSCFKSMFYSIYLFLTFNSAEFQEWMIEIKESSEKIIYL